MNVVFIQQGSEMTLWLLKIPEKIVCIHIFTVSIAKTREYVAPVIGRPKTVDDDVLIKTITRLSMAESSPDSH